MLARRKWGRTAMNMIEKILAKASGRKRVVPGDIVTANVDLMVMHDLSSSLVARVFRDELGGGKIADPSKIVFVFDHNISPRNPRGSRNFG